MNNAANFLFTYFKIIIVGCVIPVIIGIFGMQFSADYLNYGLGESLAGLFTFATPVIMFALLFRGFRRLSTINYFRNRIK